MIITLDKDTRLELTAQKHAEGLFRAVNRSREYLSEFLPWVENMRSVDDFKEYIRNTEALHGQQKDLSFVIVLNERIVGRIGLHYINPQHKAAAIGYWLTEDARGKGIITRACKELIDYGFREIGLHRIEIKVAVQNFKSQAIPEKFHFKKEGILRHAERVNNNFLDLFVYSMLRHEWQG